MHHQDRKDSPGVFPEWTIPLFLAALGIISFCIWLPDLGYYWDDWTKIFVARIQGLQAYWLYYSGDRPFSAWTHLLLTPALGTKPIAWQIFTLILRFSSAVGVFLLLTLLRKGSCAPAAAAAAIFLVFPLFSQQPIAIVFHQQWLQFALLLASFCCMVISIQSPRKRWGWAAVSLILSLLQLSITEYFAPLELIRPILLWLNLENMNDGRTRFMQVIRLWAPYVVVILAFFIWRMFLMPIPIDPTYQGNGFFQYLSDPTASFSWLGKALVIDLAYILIGCWGPALESRLTMPLSLTYTGIAFLSFAAGVMAAYYLVRVSPDDSSERAGRSWIQMALILGPVGILLGPMPAWITQNRVLFDGHSDRYALPALLGLSILAAGLIEWMGRSRLQKAILAGILIGLGCGYQMRNSFDYKVIWDQQMRLYWQLFWRAPQLENPTAVYSETELIPNQGLFSMSAALNQLYPQKPDDPLVGFWFYTLRPKYDAGPPKSINVSNDSTFRTLHFIGSSPNTLLIHSDPAHGNCLWVLRSEDIGNPYLSDLIRSMIPLSNLERILPESQPGFPPQDLFGAEPDHGWCYNFEKAELAWQRQDWHEVARLGDQVKSEGYSPLAELSNSPREWWPFIVGYAHDGKIREAITLSQQSLRRDPHYHDALCRLWLDMTDVPEMGVGVSELGCSEPKRED